MEGAAGFEIAAGFLQFYPIRLNNGDDIGMVPECLDVDRSWLQYWFRLSSLFNDYGLFNGILVPEPITIVVLVRQAIHFSAVKFFSELFKSETSG